MGGHVGDLPESNSGFKWHMKQGCILVHSGVPEHGMSEQD